MDPLSNSATLLILTAREEEAEGLVTSLRNGGLAVQGIFTSEPERLEELTSTNAVELILCCEHDPAVDLDAWMSKCRELELDIPFVIIASAATESDVLIQALRTGARDLTEQGDSDHLQVVVARELSDYGHRRSAAHLRERLEECEKRARELVDATGEAVAFIKEGIHVQVNPAYQELYGFENPDELDGFPLLDLVPGEHQQKVRDALRLMEQHGTIVPAELDVECTRVDGGRFDAHLCISRSQLEGEPCVRVMIDARLPEVPQPTASSLDADTDLPNRAALLEEIESRIRKAEPKSAPFVIIYVGINIFPTLLQDRGLTGGLKATARFAGFLRDLAPDDAYLARITEDAYVLLISNPRRSDQETLAATIRQKARLPIEQDPQDEDKPQCGTGLLLVDFEASSPSDLLDTVYRSYVFGMLQATAGTDESKEPDSLTNGPQETELDEESQDAERIRHALDNDGFLLVYQPIVSLKGDRQESYNVLLRLKGEDGTLIEAKDFLDLAIKSGTMVAVDRWVIRNAIAELAEQRAQGQEINFFLSIAEETLQEEKLLIWICDSLQEFQARGSWLTLQILEEHARRHAAVVSKLSEGLRKVSCRIALNRFGAASNPELLLRSLHLDYVKFIPDLGQGLADQRPKQRQLHDLTKLCRDAGVKSVVTGVEDARSLTVLWTAGIDYVQGNFLQRPSPEIGQAHHS